jgi:hypothetical protein
MTESAQDDSTSNLNNTEINASELFLQLRRKQGTWVEWGQACQALQKSGYNAQTIFEETGFEPIQQNQVIVGAQVYATIVAVGVTEATQALFNHKGSDILYELRILTQPERAAIANLVQEKSLDVDDAKDVVKAVKDFSRLGTPPEGFSYHPGDAVAYQAWKQARQKSDLQERSRLIAKGLRFAHSETARQHIEKLLTDFAVVPAKPAPLLPIYRLEEDEFLPRIIPVVGKLPLTKTDLQAVPLVEESDSFGMVQFSGAGAWVAVPGWQVIRLAEDPIALLEMSDRFPTPLPGKTEEVLVIVDRAQRTWDASSYFLIEETDQLHIRWFDDALEAGLLGRIVLIMRSKKVLDNEYTKDPWQMDE